MEELVEMISCKRCGLSKPAGKTPGWCVDCEKAYNSRYSYLRMSNPGWMDTAKDAGLELWERQPGETQLEWSVWQLYRDSYPGSKPNYRQIAAKLDCSYEYVKKIASRWDFQLRMQAWIVDVDKRTLAQRRQAMVDMNAEHISMAKALQDKLKLAIDQIDPYSIKPSEINSLMKTMTDLERKARVDDMALIEASQGGFMADENPELKKSPTKKEDLSEVLQILLKAGALGDVGVRTTKTETTEVVIKGEHDDTTV